MRSPIFVCIYLASGTVPEGEGWTVLSRGPMDARGLNVAGVDKMDLFVCAVWANNEEEAKEQAELLRQCSCIPGFWPEDCRDHWDLAEPCECPCHFPVG